MFDKKTFSEILKKIYNTYSNQREFADATDVNRAYLSQYINQKLNNPPTPKILVKIANASHGITTYEELMTVCGHIKENDLDSYVLGMLGLTEHDILEFNNSLKEIELSDNEEIIFRNIVKKMRDEISHNNQNFKLDIVKYIKNENRETQSKIIKALNLYMEYLKKTIDFASVAIKALNLYMEYLKKTIDFASVATNSISNETKVDEDTPEIRAIARDVANLKPDKKELFKKLLKEMSDKADEAKK